MKDGYIEKAIIGRTTEILDNAKLIQELDINIHVDMDSFPLIEYKVKEAINPQDYKENKQ